MLEKDLALYIHWPFCVSRCPYCDFNVHIRKTIDEPRWREAYIKEIAHYAALMPGRRVVSVFFGGGTPSLMAPETAAALLASIRQGWSVAENVEITLEANPGDAEAEKFSAFNAAGINRLSLGVQSLDDEALAFLGRRHNAAQARKALETARAVFARYSFDLIYARPGQTLKSWRAELQDALDYSGGHLSPYQLTLEKGTKFDKLARRGELVMPDNDLSADFYEITLDILEDAGLLLYEVSNHAAPGQESVHNLVYWRYGDYAGIGPGAHGRITVEGQKYATQALRSPDKWMKQVESSGNGREAMDSVPGDEQFIEALMTGLRLKEGISLKVLEHLSGVSWQKSINSEALSRCAEEGWLVRDGEQVKLTRAGFLRLNALLGYIIR